MTFQTQLKSQHEYGNTISFMETGVSTAAPEPRLSAGRRTGPETRALRSYRQNVKKQRETMRSDEGAFFTVKRGSEGVK